MKKQKIYMLSKFSITLSLSFFLNSEFIVRTSVNCSSAKNSIWSYSRGLA